MLDFIIDNIGNLIVGAALLAVIAWAIGKTFTIGKRNKEKAAKCGSCCACSHGGACGGEEDDA
jgi:hypothetical protein